jgi:hypothetical protein
MADAAVLVFEGAIVPVGCGLEGKRHHNEGQEYGQNSACDVPTIQQILQSPIPMPLRRTKRRNGRFKFMLVSLNSPARSHLQHIAIARHQFVQHRIDEETEEKAREQACHNHDREGLLRIRADARGKRRG